jgi:uncharacterized membrane protein
MGKNRLEAFSDGVIAIIITIMVLEMKVPHGDTLAAIAPLLPVFLSYALSFLYIGIYWNNHHHLLHTVQRISAPILWTNLHLLFWLSLLPFVTGWAGENHFAPLPSLLYGVDLLMAGVAYYLLQLAILKTEGKTSTLRTALGSDFKGKGSIAAYAVAVALAMVLPHISLTIYVLVALWWFIPDRRIVKALERNRQG